MTSSIGKVGAVSLAVDGLSSGIATPGQTVAVYWSGVTARSNDFIGLYRVDGPQDPYSNILPADTPLLTNGTASGNASVVLPNEPGYYNFVLYNWGAGITPTYAGRSAAFWIQAPGATGQGSVVVFGGDALGGGLYPGGAANYAYRTATPTSPTDWIGLFLRGDADDSGHRVSYATVAGLAGGGAYPLPSNLATGYYELRYHRGSTWDLWSTSAPFFVGGPLPSGNVARTFDSIRNNASQQRCSFDISKPHGNDYIQLCPVGTATQAAYAMTGGGAAGYADVSTLNLTPGQYEAQLVSYYGNGPIAVSPSFTVTT